MTEKVPLPFRATLRSCRRTATCDWPAPRDKHAPGENGGGQCGSPSPPLGLAFRCPGSRECLVWRIIVSTTGNNGSQLGTSIAPLRHLVPQLGDNFDNVRAAMLAPSGDDLIVPWNGTCQASHRDPTPILAKQPMVSFSSLPTRSSPRHRVRGTPSLASKAIAQATFAAVSPRSCPREPLWPLVWVIQGCSIHLQELPLQGNMRLQSGLF